MIISEPGLYAEMDADSYFADPSPSPSLNQSLIPLLLERSPLHAAFQHPRLNPYRPEAPGDKARYLGAAAHRLALGRGKEISTVRYPDYTSSSARDARDLAIANGRIPVLEREYVKARDMADILKVQIADACEGHPYMTEVAMFWQEDTPHGPIWCRGMADVYCPAIALVLDPKTLRIPATAEAFGRTAAADGYDLQNSWYRRAVEAIMPDIAGRVRFANLVVESSPPHGAQMFELDPMSRSVADWRVARAIAKWGECLHTRTWPGYPRGIQVAKTPSYYQQQIEASAMLASEPEG